MQLAEKNSQLQERDHQLQMRMKELQRVERQNISLSEQNKTLSDSLGELQNQNLSTIAGSGSLQYPGLPPIQDITNRQGAHQAMGA